jgi:hypothetical protein
MAPGADGISLQVARGNTVLSNVLNGVVVAIDGDARVAVEVGRIADDGAMPVASESQSVDEQRRHRTTPPR